MSLNEIKSRSKEAGVLSILTEETDDFHGFRPWDDKNPQAALIPRRFSVENRVVDQTEVQPNAGFGSSTFLAGSVVDFRLDTADISVIDHAFLCCNITNSTGAAVVLPPTSFWFDKIEILSPNQNTLATITDIDNWMAVCMLPRTDFEQLAELMSTSTAYSTAGVSIANGASTELYLPLITMINAARLHLPGLKGPLTFRFRTKASAINLISGTHPTFTKVVMLLSGFDEPQAKRNMRTAFYRNQITRFQNTPTFLPFYGWDHFTFSQAMVASTRTDVKLSGFAGMFAGVFVLVRVLPFTAANQGTLIALESLQIADESGAIFCGNHLKTHARSRVIAAAQMPNLSAKSVNYYVIPFSSDVVGDFVTGKNGGFQVFKGNEVLTLTLNSAAASTNYQIDVIGLRANSLRVFRGDIEKRQ